MSADITRPQGDSQLTIPEEAIEAAAKGISQDAWRSTRTQWAARDALEAGAPLIVAAELERLAGALNQHADSIYPGDAAAGVFSGALLTAASKLTRRAAELRGGA